jgi:NADPH2:quinone reductase
MNDKTHAVLVSDFGGPEVMEWKEVPLSAPDPGEALIRHTAVGLNFIDTYHRSGLYPLDLPIVPGTEAAGVVEAVGSDVTDLGPGDRVAYTGLPVGSYAERRCYAADRLVPLPDDIDDQTAAAIMLKGLTAWYLLHRSYRASAGDTVLLYAAAGGVGTLLAQWAKHLGVNVIGVAGRRSGFRQQGPRPERRWRIGGLRLCGQGHVLPVSRLPQASRDDGVVR